MISIWTVRFLKFAGNRIYKTLKYNKQQKIIDNYVNKPNELDIQMGQLQKNKEKQGKYIEELEKKVATLEREISTLKTDSHPPILKEKDVKKIMRRIKYLERKIK